MGETRVDLLHLLEDLADAYPGDLEETVLTEIVANALDSGASTVAIRTDAAGATLTVIDDGTGMRRADLRRFHDVAASAKERGSGIGFAGVGIKLGLLVSEEVVTETRRGKDHIATTWALVRRQRAPWHWITPTGLVLEHGTAVRLRLENPLSPLLDAGYLETTLRRHFEPLFDASFEDVLRDHYPRGVSFDLNGQPIARAASSLTTSGEVATLAIRLARKRKPSAYGYLRRELSPLSDDRRGIAISTFGKVIKRGWDWLGMSPAAADRVSGLIEAPALAASLTLNKGDFLRTGPRGAVYLAYRRAIQEAVAEQLAAWGDTPEDQERSHRRAARPVERDVERVLLDLADEFPLLAMLVERRAGGQKRLPVGRGNGRAAESLPDLFAPGPEMEPEGTAAEPSEAGTPPSSPPNEDSSTNEPSPRVPAPAELPARRGPRRPTRLGLSIQFETRSDLAELARLVETTVWVNDAHPAYQRAAASRSEGYHLALSVAMALAAVVVEPAQASAFVTEFLARWGESESGRQPRGRRSARRSGRRA